MMNKLATLIVTQKELTQEIGDNVTDAVVNVQGGQKELVKFHNTVSSNRGMILRIFGILIVFVIFVGFFLIK